eukprot:6201080-Pleurochrysis_carterae.AAC.3
MKTAPCSARGQCAPTCIKLDEKRCRDCECLACAMCTMILPPQVRAERSNGIDSSMLSEKSLETTYVQLAEVALIPPSPPRTLPKVSSPPTASPPRKQHVSEPSPVSLPLVSARSKAIETSFEPPRTVAAAPLASPVLQKLPHPRLDLNNSMRRPFTQCLHETSSDAPSRDIAGSRLSRGPRPASLARAHACTLRS